jgi:hypothetical protein
MMVYIINVYGIESKEIIKSFETLSAEEAGVLDTQYSVLGHDVSIEPDVMAYLDKYQPKVKRTRRTPAEMQLALSRPTSAPSVSP